MIYLSSKQGNSKLAIRYSELEGLDTVLNMRGKVQWVWVDCFSKLPIDFKIYKTLKDAGFKLCLVSPELQGREEDINQYKDYLSNQNIVFDAICTKLRNVEVWR